jgi:hypothetical protein
VRAARPAGRAVRRCAAGDPVNRAAARRINQTSQITRLPARRGRHRPQATAMTAGKID